MGPVSTRRYRCLASGDPTGLWSSLHTSPVSTGRVRCEAAERPVWLMKARVCGSRGGNGRVQTASDTWLTPKHQTVGVEHPMVPAVGPVPTCFAK